MAKALPAIVLLLAGLVSLLLYTFAFDDPTDANHWQAAAEHVREHLKDDDTFRVEPTWSETVLPYLVEVGSQANRQRVPLLEDLYRYERVWVLSQTSRLDDALARLPFSTAEAETKSFGTVSVAVVEVPEDSFSYVFLDELASARVSRVKGEDEERCEKYNERERRWDCARRDRWFYVGQALREVGDEPRECIWAHPLDGGRTLRITYPQVPVEDVLRVRASFDLRAARSSRGTDLQFRVYVDDEPVVDHRFAHDDHSYPAFDIDTTRWDRPVDVRMEVDALESVRDRFFCLNGWVLNGR